MSNEEKNLVEEMAAEEIPDVDTKPDEAVAETGAEPEIEAEVEAEPETEGEDAIAAESVAEADVSRPTATALTTKEESGPTANERTWAALAHASVLLTFILGIASGGLVVIFAVFVPLIIWLAFRDKSRYVAYHAMQATVFQVASLLVWVGLLVAGAAILIPAWIVTALLLVILIGLLLLPLVLVLTIALAAALVLLPFVSLVYGLYAALEVYAGRTFRYWRVADWMESRNLEMAA